jgi:hypothetical protein
MVGRRSATIAVVVLNDRFDRPLEPTASQEAQPFYCGDWIGT